MRFRVTAVTRDKDGNITEHHQSEHDLKLLQPHVFGTSEEDGVRVPVDSVELKMVGDNYVAITINYIQ